MTIDDLTPEQRIEVQDNLIFRHNAQTRRARWEATKGKRPAVRLKKYNMSGDLIEEGGMPSSKAHQPSTAFEEHGRRRGRPAACR